MKKQSEVERESWSFSVMLNVYNIGELLGDATAQQTFLSGTYILFSSTYTVFPEGIEKCNGEQNESIYIFKNLS